MIHCSLLSDLGVGGRHLAMSVYKLKASVTYLTELSTLEPQTVYTFHCNGCQLLHYWAGFNVTTIPL
jgi:hypothetical protein